MNRLHKIAQTFEAIGVVLLALTVLFLVSMELPEGRVSKPAKAIAEITGGENEPLDQ